MCVWEGPGGCVMCVVGGPRGCVMCVCVGRGCVCVCVKKCLKRIFEGYYFSSRLSSAHSPLLVSGFY